MVNDDLSAALFAGTMLDDEPVAYVLDDVDCPATLCAESDGALDRGRGGERCSLSCVDESSSLPFNRREISTVDVWCQDWPQG